MQSRFLRACVVVASVIPALGVFVATVESSSGEEFKCDTCADYCPGETVRTCAVLGCYDPKTDSTTFTTCNQGEHVEDPSGGH